MKSNSDYIIAIEKALQKVQKQDRSKFKFDMMLTDQSVLMTFGKN